MLEFVSAHNPFVQIQTMCYYACNYILSLKKFYHESPVNNGVGLISCDLIELDLKNESSLNGAMLLP